MAAGKGIHHKWLSGYNQSSYCSTTECNIYSWIQKVCTICKWTQYFARYFRVVCAALRFSDLLTKRRCSQLHAHNPKFRDHLVFGCGGCYLVQVGVGCALDDLMFRLKRQHYAWSGWFGGGDTTGKNGDAVEAAALVLAWRCHP